MAPSLALLLFHGLPHTLRDHSRIVVDGERRRALKSMRSRYEDAKPALERISGNPRFVRPHGVPAASDHGRLNAFTAGAGNTLDVEDRTFTHVGTGIVRTRPCFPTRSTMHHRPSRC